MVFVSVKNHLHAEYFLSVFWYSNNFQAFNLLFYINLSRNVKSFNKFRKHLQDFGKAFFCLLKRRYNNYDFLFRVITPFHKALLHLSVHKKRINALFALLRLLERHYNAFYLFCLSILIPKGF